ncbi:MAG: rRNA maturation RNase YbeY [Rhodobacteraceae bacterium]|nr:rRNA maturation RNase YbeY [Paracoccaceae bacterium]
MIEVILEDDRWEAVGLAALCDPAERVALELTGRVPEGFEIALMGCDDARIAVLNQDFRGKEAATNVLSWPASEAPPMADGELGDIAIAFDTCQREAIKKGISIQNHVTHLVIHGILHLLGYDHISDVDAEEMEALEIKALAKLGISNPY